ncbi:response regulator transcription factor [Moritella sp. Urea-trap-13]|uniref:response regulator transcription factor n=1 Tax=Moritella sp. Urea-trap-13 TaxID=2058327 RepID=UPI0018E2B422|nr:response regulator [Moritella sp. Urea-trap-13]
MSLTVPVYVVDDDESVRDSLAFMLEGYDVNVTTYAGGPTFLDNADIMLPGCVTLDSRMPELRGQDVQAILTQCNSPLSIIFLTGHGDVSMAVDAFKSGAVDFFQKPVDGEKLLQAIILAAEKSLQRSEQLKALSSYQSLTERERDILLLLVQGKRNQQIADDLCIAVRTVEVHRSSLMKKFNAKTIAELVLQYGMAIN